MKAKKKELMLDYIDSLDNAAEELQGLSDMIGYLGQIIRVLFHGDTKKSLTSGIRAGE